jgi:hypothetical protein
MRGGDVESVSGITDARDLRHREAMDTIERFG